MHLFKIGFRGVLLLFVCLGVSVTIHAQTNGVVLDTETMLPIPFASIHTKGANVRGTMSNDEGVFAIDFKFDTLYFSHINYELVKWPNRKTKNDTILMNPISHAISGIVITAKNTKWVENILKSVVKNKSKNYQQKEISLDYTFNLQSLSDSSGYAFESKGKILSPEYSEKEGFKICPKLNIVKYKDETAGPDFMQLRRSVYEDFIHDFDNGFIKKHRFTQTSYIDENNENIVQFAFEQRKGEGNSGYVMVDTLNKVITEFEQISDTDYNIKSNTSFFTRTIASSRGFEYTIWRTVIHGRFSLIDESYHLTDSRYQLYRQSKARGGKDLFFTNIESRLTMKTPNVDVHIGTTEKCNWLKLPTPRSITIIMGKETRLAEEALDNVVVKYQLF